MVAKIEDLVGLPGWPRLLSLEQVTAYLSMSKDVFMQGMAQGKWPKPLEIGARRRVWDRLELDAAVDRLTGVPAHLSASSIARAKEFANRMWDEALRQESSDSRYADQVFEEIAAAARKRAGMTRQQRIDLRRKEREEQRRQQDERIAREREERARLRLDPQPAAEEPVCVVRPAGAVRGARTASQ